MIAQYFCLLELQSVCMNNKFIEIVLLAGVQEDQELTILRLCICPNVHREH